MMHSKKLLKYKLITYSRCALVCQQKRFWRQIWLGDYARRFDCQRWNVHSKHHNDIDKEPDDTSHSCKQPHTALYNDSQQTSTRSVLTEIKTAFFDKTVPNRNCVFLRVLIVIIYLFR